MQIANLFVPGAIITIILGLLACFFGYKIKKFALFIIWFIIGYNLGLKVPSDWYMGNELITAILPFCIGLCSRLLVSRQKKSVFHSSLAFLPSLRQSISRAESLLCKPPSSPASSPRLRWRLRSAAIHAR
jgi:hypothetical protein